MNYNKVILIGNLTRDPQMTYLPSQTAVVEIGLAVNRKWKASDGTAKEEVCFVDARAYGKQAETINQYCHKGDTLMVEGRLTLDTWEAKDGTKRSKHRVTVEQFHFGDKRAKADAGAPAESDPPPPAQSTDSIPF